jgi:predicted dehydrogenase
VQYGVSAGRLLPTFEPKVDHRPMTRVLLVGLGRWGANHLRVLRSLPVELHCADADAAKLAAAAKAGVPEVRLATDPVTLVSKVDCVIVATPAETHFSLAKLCLEAGKDVLVEKPLTVVSAEALKLAELAERSQRNLQVGYIFRFDPAAQWLKEAIAGGEFGRLKMLRGTFSGFKRPRTDSGVSFADGVHFIDLFNHFMGTPPARVTGHLHDFFGRGMEDQSLISLEYERPGGQTVWATVETGYHAPGKAREVTVMGDKLSAICDFNVAQYKVRTFEAQHQVKAGAIDAVEGATRQLEFPPVEPLLAEVSAFVEAVKTGKPQGADGRAGYWATRVVEAAMQSARERRTVALD